MPVMRALYLIPASGRKLSGYHSHAYGGALSPLCKLDGRQSGDQKFIKWLHEDGSATCPACRKLAKEQLIGGAV